MRLAILAAVSATSFGCAAFGAESATKPGAMDGVIGGAPDPTLNGAINARGAVRVGIAQDFATQQQTPGPLVSDAAAVYWLNLPFGTSAGVLMKQAKGGGAPEPLAPNLSGAYALAEDSTHLFVSENQNGGGSYQFLLREDKSGGAPVSVQVDANDELSGISAELGSVFWSLTSNGGAVGSVDANEFSPSTKVTIATATGNVRVLTADAQYIYAATVGKIVRVDRATHDIVDFATTSGLVNAIIFDAPTSSVFWTEAAVVRRLGAESPGAPPANLANDQQGATAMALDASYVYWTNLGDGSIRVVAKQGGAWGAIATGEKEPQGIAVDDSGVYWTNHGDNRVRYAARTR
jgi:hypothetical protein